jgi:hypothetical protein
MSIFLFEENKETHLGYFSARLPEINTLARILYFCSIEDKSKHQLGRLDLSRMLKERIAL